MCFDGPGPIHHAVDTCGRFQTVSQSSSATLRDKKEHCFTVLQVKMASNIGSTCNSTFEHERQWARDGWNNFWERGTAYASPNDFAGWQKVYKNWEKVNKGSRQKSFSSPRYWLHSVRDEPRSNGVMDFNRYVPLLFGSDRGPCFWETKKDLFLAR